MTFRLLFLVLFGFGVCNAFAQTYVPGESYFDGNGYVEYLAGNLPIIITAPHGGLLAPASIPDRDCAGCSVVNDFNTQELARAFAQAVHARTGCWPHVIFNKLHRRKLDANRDIAEAADGNPAAESAWYAFHAFVETAKNQLLPQFGKGLYIDLHGHGHAIQRLELGYLLSKAELALQDATLNTPFYVDQSSIRHLAGNNVQSLSHAELLHGSQSLGELLAQRGYPATPSESDPFPDADEDYFNGGYNTARHSSYQNGALDGLQIECNRNGIRDSMHNVLRFADSLSVTVMDYLGRHFFGSADAFLCGMSSTPPEVSLPDQLLVFPQPYCYQFTVKKSRQAPPGNWTLGVYDFFGNMLGIHDLDDDTELTLNPSPPGHVWLVLWVDGEMMGMRSIFRFCR